MAKHFFKAIINQLNAVIKLDQDKQLTKIMNNKEIKDQIIFLNTWDQLYDRGVNSDGVSLGRYSKYTQEIKQAEGKPWEHVTLNDTGAFYKSFRVKDNGAGVVITAETEKQTDDLSDKYGRKILGLTYESLQIIRPKVRTFILQDLRKTCAA